MDNESRLSFAVIADALPCGLILLDSAGDVAFINRLAETEALVGVSVGTSWKSACSRFGRAPLVATAAGLDLNKDPLLVSVGSEVERRYFYACTCSCPLADGEYTLVVLGNAGTALELTQHLARTLRLELTRAQPTREGQSDDARALARRLSREVAHHIRNPLAYVLGNAELLREHAERQSVDLAPAEMLTMLEDIEHGARRIERVLSRLDRARLDAPAEEPMLGVSFYSKG